MDSGLGCVERFGESCFQDGKEGVLQVVVGVLVVGRFHRKRVAQCGSPCGGILLWRNRYCEFFDILLGHGGGDLFTHGGGLVDGHVDQGLGGAELDGGLLGKFFLWESGNARELGFAGEWDGSVRRADRQGSVAKEFGE